MARVTSLGVARWVVVTPVGPGSGLVLGTGIPGSRGDAATVVGLPWERRGSPAHRQSGPSRRSWPRAGALSTEAAGIWERQTQTRMYGGAGAGRAISPASRLDGVIMAS